jgi:hypothetical protein
MSILWDKKKKEKHASVLPEFIRWSLLIVIFIGPKGTLYVLTRALSTKNGVQ